MSRLRAIPGLIGPPPSEAILGDLEGQRRLLANNRQQWFEFCLAEPIPRPPSVTTSHLDRMSDIERREYAAARRLYHGDLVVDTPAMAYVAQELTEIVNVNMASSRVPPLPGLALDGMGGAGKSTILFESLRRYTRRRMAEVAGAEWGTFDPMKVWIGTGDMGAAFTPCVLAQLAGKPTENGLLSYIFEFIGVPIPRELRSATAKLEMLKTVLEALKVEILVVDEIHAFKPYMANYEQSISFNKSILNGTRATVVIAGQELETNQLLAEGLVGNGNSTSTSRRFARVPVGYFPNVNDVDAQQWRDVIEQFDDRLVLAEHRPGDLLKHASVLHQLSTGALGTLVNLVTRVAERAVQTGVERVTDSLINSILLDAGATAAARPEELKAPATKATSKRKNQPKRSTQPVTAGRGVAT